jgi:hypothetical protein
MTVKLSGRIGDAVNVAAAASGDRGDSAADVVDNCRDDDRPTDADRGRRPLATS